MVTEQFSHEKVMALLPDRQLNTHKGDYGRILLLCGSVGYTGAPALAAMGALRIGAGLVYLCVPSSVYEIEATKLLEPVIIPVKEKNGKFSADAVDHIGELLPKMDAVLIGPGIGCSEDTYHVVKWVLENFSGPVVVDADGINVLEGHMDILRGRTSPTILTPHEGEFVRLGGELTDNRQECAMRLAADIGCIVVLKGYGTVITDGSACYINTSGNPGMAVGGSGDVLAGIITGLLGQGLTPIEASACGAWLHGAAGDLCAKEIGQYGMLPSDMLYVLPRLLK